MKSNKGSKFRILTALVLCCMLAMSSWLAMLERVSGSTAYGGAISAGLTKVDGLSLDELRTQYFDEDIVKLNQLDPNEKRWVVVDLGGRSLIDSFSASTAGDFAAYASSAAGKAQASQLRQSHNSFLARLSSQSIDYEYKYSYTTLNNGVAIRVANKDIGALAKVSGVRGVYRSESFAQPTVAVSNNANVYSTGIYDSHDLAYQGEGMVVAILDTGLDHTHPAFSQMPQSANAWTRADVEARFASTLAKTELATATEIDQVYYNAKVPYAFDYADKDPDVYPAYSTHGTHVAGIVAGRDDGKTVNSQTGETFIGVAPQAQLAIMKVFTDNLDSEMLGSADTIDILAALSDCATLGVDVINMSLGSSAGFSTEETDLYLQSVYDHIEDLGISLVVAASNDASSGYGGGHGTNLASNPDSGTVGSPSTYSASLSVASINGQKSRYVVANKSAGGDEQVAFITESSDGNGNNLDFMKGIYQKLGAAESAELTLNYVLVGGVGRATNYTATVKNALADGKTIAVVKRGDITFAEKVENAMLNGALGCIIYNNVSGTIRMSLGEVEKPIPTCSISMDAGKILVSGAVRSVGTLTLSYDYAAGPFMSDFSSWGVTPDLKLKPEITAHGGEITSAVPGGYDEYSGTSMAAPNMAGAIAILRQHVQDDQGLSGKALSARVNQLLMSTAFPALNEEGNPYSPRKQGAGLAGIRDAINTQSYITVGSSDKTKIELGDDKTRKGEYVLEFSVHNFSPTSASYVADVSVMTESLATDLLTVAERAHMLTDSVIAITVDGASVSSAAPIVIASGQTVDITIKITLGQLARDYIDQSFVNGMYVEGFARLIGQEGAVSLGVPYLAFYGDWLDAPLFDYSVYEIAQSEADSSVDPEDKLKASSAASTPYGLYEDGKYIIPLGTYLYTMSEFDSEIYPSEEHAAVSIYDQRGRRTIYELYMTYAGLLRGAKTLDVAITDSFTGEQIYQKTEHNIRKAYAAGGSMRGSPVMLEINPYSWGLNNNSTFNVSMSGTLDYPGGENPSNNSFEFGFSVDYEAPIINDYRIRFEPYTENKEVKYRIYMDVDVFDNQYAQALLPCYVKDNMLTLLTEFPVPIYSQKNSQTTVSFEVTDYYDDYIKTGKLYLAVEDYALNETFYQVNAQTALDYPDSVSLSTDDKLVLASDEGEYGVYNLTLAPNESYKVKLNALPDANTAPALTWEVSNSRVRVFEGELFAASSGTATVTLKSAGVAVAQINVTIEGSALAAPIPERVTLKPIINGSDRLSDLSSGEVTLNPNQVVQVYASVQPWYCSGLSFVWSSSNTNVMTVDSAGRLTTKTKGTAYLTVRVVGFDRLTATVKVTVGSDFRVVNYTLYDYYGGADVVIPDDLNIMYIDDEAFQNNTKITSVVLPSTLLEIGKFTFAGCTSLRTVTIPSECTIIGEGAFEGCISLQTVILKEFEDKIDGSTSTGALTVGRAAFKGCVSLKTIENSLRITTAYDRAFVGCSALEAIDLSGLRISGEEVFADCTALKTVVTSAHTAIGKYMFDNCTALQSFTFKGSRVSDGAFMGCTNLSSLTFDTPELTYLGAYAFFGTAISTITLPNGTYSIGNRAFGSCASLQTVALSPNTLLIGTRLSPFDGCLQFDEFVFASTSNHYTLDGGMLLSLDGSTVVLVPYGLGSIALASSVTRIGAGAFGGNKALTSINLTSITEIAPYAFANTRLTSVILPATLTAIPEGLFYGCSSLTSVTLGAQVTSIGAMAFFGCTALTGLDFDGVEHIGDSAFMLSGLTSLNAVDVVTVGDHAFSDTKLVFVVLDSVASLGDYAFANNSQLVSADFGGAVTFMGQRLLENSQNLATVVLGEGTTMIGDWAFGSTNARPKLVQVTLPSSVRTVGEGAFYNVNMLTTLELGGVEEIGSRAFAFAESLTALDLSSATTIGFGAFAYTTALTEANLTSAEEIGGSAFAFSGISMLTIPAVKIIGDYAFEQTALQTVTIPVGFEGLTYDETWYRIDDSGRPELVSGKKTARYGIGAFANIATLTAIEVAEQNPVFVSIEGVLYSRANDGLRLEQYPAGRANTSYRVADTTVRIGDSAFEGVTSLAKITLPYTVRTIGSYAFFNSSVTEYTFEAVEAPVLETTFLPEDMIDDITLLALFGFDYVGSRMYYANFVDYVALIIEEQAIKQYVSLLYEAPDFGLTINRPSNGKGYDNIVWQSYFATQNLTAYAAESVTRQAIDAIAALPTPEQVSAVLSSGTVAEQKLAIQQISATVGNARKLYNQVTEPAQIEFVTSYDDLLDVEQAVRQVKASLGIPSKVTTLSLTQKPTKIKYIEGESFDPAGMIISAIFDDLSQITVTDYVVDKTVLAFGDEFVKISYQGQELLVYVSVEQATAEPPTPPAPPEEDEMPTWLVILLRAAGIAAIGLLIGFAVIKLKNTHK